MAENEITVVEQKNEVLQVVDLAKITEYLDSTGLTKSLLPNEKAMFVNMAQLYGLNPFKREIYCTVFGEGKYRQCSIVTGYEVYLKRAERVGKLDGWEATLSGKVSDETLSATVTIYRKDWSHPFKHTVYYREVVQRTKDGTPNRFWRVQPTFMTRKVAIAQAFRLCFPDEFGGMPYTNDEMGVEPEPQNITNEATTTFENQQEIPVVNIEEIKKEPTEAAINLEAVLNDNKKYFNPADWKRANECLQKGTPEQIEATYNWACGYVEWAKGRES